ncbi:uncharacterized protein J8A68_004819 [[Candida] subhashii]|uniref:Glutathione S-transferase n=1 Tax=[Candida] subhashii TaxID=561895 RepID=A0A8J5UK51_9ASCO|nr:uncharacterized protein J8A68_004819 [[Candida] subhashii]KAG7661666.1 hypothetical protein J8A68_004819 [[Candida] subhashii]
MTLTLYTAPTGNGFKPTILLNFLNIPFTLHLFPWPTPEIKQEWYLKINPNGRIPSIVDDGIRLNESNAILLYLADKYDKEGKVSYKVNDGDNYWKQIQWLFFQSTQFTNAFQQLFIYRTSNVTDEQVLGKAFANSDNVYSVLEGQLKKGKFIVGDKFTIVDISFVSVHYRMVKTLEGTIYEIKDFAEKYSRCQEWYCTCYSFKEVREAFEKVAN